MVAPVALPTITYTAPMIIVISAHISRFVNVNIENAVLPLRPYPRLFILSDVSTAFSSAHVVITDRIVSPFFALCIILPWLTSLPIAL